MSAFEYLALDQSKRETKGTIEAETAKHARNALRNQGLIPIKITAVTSKKIHNSFRLSLKKRMGANDLAILTRQLATLNRSGLPLDESLEVIAKQHEKPRTKQIILAVRSRVLEGYTLADSLGDFPFAFPKMYCTTVAAGEESGHLDAVLERLADFTESRQELQQQIKNAMIYPMVLAITAISIISFMLAYVVPKVITIFINYNQQLPVLTRIMISCSEFLQNYWLLMIGIIFSLILLGKILLKKTFYLRKYHHFLLKLPLIKKLTIGINTARFTRTLGILAGSGVPILKALKISSQVVTNMPMRSAIEVSATRVEEGEMISRSLSISQLFPIMVIHLIASGEASGNLDEMLLRAAKNQEKEVDNLISTLIGIMQPLLVIIMAIIVLLIVLAILLPIFEINNLIS